MRRLEIGVFLPVAKNGFYLTRNSPAYEPSFADQLEITRLAEDLGLDYAFSMAKWRGFGGDIRFWDSSLESVTLTAALAAATSTIKLIATVNPLLTHPAAMAKMAATLDDVCQGRLGLNIITGAILAEYEQMGVLPPGYDAYRYEYATEWVQVLKRLWAEPSVTHHGKYFHLEDCVSEPKPLQRPHPFLVCAASSEEGMRFTARETDYSFTNGKNVADFKAKSLRTKEIAAEENTTLKTAIGLFLCLKGTPSDAADYWQHLLDGADTETIGNMAAAFSGQSRDQIRERGAHLVEGPPRILPGDPMIGDPHQVADELIGLAEEGDVDSVLLVLPDYLDGIRRFGTEVMPLLSRSLDVGAR